jgi:hypothetical protein
MSIDVLDGDVAYPAVWPVRFNMPAMPAFPMLKVVY